MTGMSIYRRLLVSSGRRPCPWSLPRRRPLSSVGGAEGGADGGPPSFASVQKDLAFLPEVKEAEELTRRGGGDGKRGVQRAIPLLQRAEEILESSMGKANLMALAVRSQRASAHLRLGEWSSAEKVLRSLEAELQLGRHSAGDVVGTRLLLGGSLLLQARLDEALSHSLDTLQLVERKAESYTSLLARACQLVGVCHLYKAGGQQDDAYDMLQKAARLAGQSVWQCRTGSTLGMWHWYHHEEQRSAADVKEAVAVWEETIEGLERPPEGSSSSSSSEGERLWESELWLNLAEAHLWEGPGKGRELDKAEEAASKALKLQESCQLQDGDPRLGRTLAVVARHRHLIGQAVSAEGLFRSAIDSLGDESGGAGTLPAYRYELHSALTSYGLLLKDWDRRERDAEQVALRAKAVPLLVLNPRVPVRSAIYIEGTGTDDSPASS